MQTTHFQTNRRKNQLVMMIQRACVRMAADVGPRQDAAKARVRIVACEWGFGAQGGYSDDPPLREQESRRGLILLARRPAGGHSLTRVILLAAVTYLLHSRYIAIKVGIKGRKGPASCSMCFSLCAFPERSALALQEPQKSRKMGVFAIFPGLRRSVTSSNGSRSLPPAAETSFS